MPNIESPCFPIELSDRCVKCGLCLPHCPTYLIGQVEGESPRGRIALMQGLASGALEATPGLIDHLDQCLGCRACETACPAQVPYGQLIDAARTELRQRGVSPGSMWRLVAWVTASRRRMGLATGLLHIVQWLRIDVLLRRLFSRDSLPGQRLALLPPRRPGTRFKSHYPSTAGNSDPENTVDLFLGCLGRTLEADTLQSAQRVLNALGYDVRVPSSQGCCGAIYQHAGFPHKAVKLAGENVRAFEGSNTVVAVSSGCLATLREYPQLFAAAGQSHAGAMTFSGRCVDLNAIVAGHKKKTGRRQDGVALHIPCTQRLTDDANAAKKVAAGCSKGVTVGNGQCCGAAGAYLIDQPHLSQTLARKIEIPDVDLILTSNIGCRIQLEAQCRERGLKTKVRHPVAMFDTTDSANSDEA